MAFFNEFGAHSSKFYDDMYFDFEGVMENMFLSNASCGARYAKFADVVTFDTKYKCIFMPLWDAGWEQPTFA